MVGPMTFDTLPKVQVLREYIIKAMVKWHAQIMYSLGEINLKPLLKIRKRSYHYL